MSDQLYRSSLRGSLKWIPHSHEDRIAYNWWFSTIDDMFEGRLRQLVEDIDAFAKYLQSVRGIVAIECHQRVNHLHAL